MIELKPDFVKGYGRKGAALFGKGEFDLAKKAYEDGLKVDGSNETCKNGVQAVSYTHLTLPTKA